MSFAFSPVSGDVHKYKVERDLGPVGYTLRNLAVGCIGEAVARHFNLVSCNPSTAESCTDVLSLPQIDIFQWIPGASAQKVEEAVNSNPSANNIAEELQAEVSGDMASTEPQVTANESQNWWSWATEQGSELKNRFITNNYTQSAQNYLADNKEWLAVTSSVITIYSITNNLLANRVKNASARNALSMGVGIGATLAGAYALDYTFDTGFQLNALKVGEIGLRVMSYHGIVQLLARPTYDLLGMGAKAVSISAKPLAYPSLKSKTE